MKKTLQKKIFLSIMLMLGMMLVNAQNVEFLGSTSTSAKGQGSSGIPANLTWNIPAGENRVMIITLWFERDHRPDPVSDNYPSGNYGADPIPIKVGGITMPQLSQWRSWQLDFDNTGAAADNSDFGIIAHQYSLTDGQGLPTGNTTIDFSGINSPKNIADEVAVSIEVYGNIGSFHTWADNGASNYSQRTFSITPSVPQPLAGRLNTETVYNAYGATTQQGALSVNSGWTTTNSLSINNSVGDGFSDDSDNPKNEGDGINLLTAYRTGVSSTTTFTITRPNTQRIQYILERILYLLPVAKPSLSGTVFMDTDGPTNINGTGNNGGGLYINVVDADGKVVATVPVATNGTFTIPQGIITQYETYTVQLSKNQGTVGQNAPTVELNGNYTNVGESTSATGNDGTADGRLSITVGTDHISGVRFGIYDPCNAGYAQVQLNGNSLTN